MTDVPTNESAPPTATPTPATRTFGSRSEEAAIRLMRAAGMVQVRVARLLKHYGLSPATHDILRVLADAGGRCASKDIAQRVATAAPDLTRLLQRLEKAGHIERGRDAEDRRVVTVRLTDTGRALLDQTAGPLASLHKQIMGRLQKADRKALVAALRRLEDDGATRV